MLGIVRTSSFCAAISDNCTAPTTSRVLDSLHSQHEKLRCGTIRGVLGTLPCSARPVHKQRSCRDELLWAPCL
eukprot:3641342-Amphidinium_carterae.3